MTASCASGDDATTDPGVLTPGGSGGAGGKGGASGQGGQSGSAGKAVTGGTSGSAGASGSGAGTAGKGGSAGSTAGSAGSAGSSAGSAGSAGTAGAAGSAGSGGDAGTAGSAGGGGDAGTGGATNCNKPEQCNGLDDDCDGQKDEDALGTNEPCAVPNKVGECAFGTTQCVGGKLECKQNVGTTQEVCDGKDNNCDGKIDNDPTDVGSSCTTDKLGLCAQGTIKCVDGDSKCVPNFQPTDESCNGFDDDCDGDVDEGFPGANQPCVVPDKVGPCAQGKTACQNSGNSCVQAVFAVPEACDGIDNDCDGQIDEAEDTEGKPCDTGLQGICAKGTTSCSQGTESCTQTTQAGPETCDGLDNDCDGTVDNMSAAKLKTECVKDFPSSKNVLDWACDQGECVISSCALNFIDCDSSPDNGCETNTSTDTNHCGGCFQTCPAINGTPTCIAGQCGSVCNNGFGDCDGVVGNGCEQNLNNDPKNCGICSKSCSNDGGSGVCNGGTCKTECDIGRADCDANGNNGCEVLTGTDPQNCGGCNKICSSANATPTCQNGQCKPVCKAGYADCDGDPTNGCEVNTKTNKDNCGSCDNACSSVNGSASCSNGICGLSCNSGYGDCDLDSNNGCEVNTSTSVQHCGGCGLACDATNGTPKCALGICSITCAAGFKNCNSNADDGCEIDSNNDINNCGGCNIKCNGTNGTAVCDQGVCKIAACNQGFANCDGSAANGCETNITGDANNCGACNNKCSSSGGAPACNGGTCGINCNLGLADCDGNSGNGCEVTLATNNANCGVCGNACALTNASANSCSAGKCNPTCNGGFGDCNGVGTDGCETNTTNNVNNCGGCGIKCVPTNADSASCNASKCVFQCKPGYADCDNNPANGCETNVASDSSNCGVCGKTCVVPGGGAGTCSGGSCTVTGCNAPLSDCDGNFNNGCETNLSTSPTNCGGCGNACSTNNMTPVCQASQCKVGTCNPGFDDCNNNPNDGCETGTSANINNCGGCGNVCTLKANATSMKCESSSCLVAACSPTFFDPDGNGANGCECKEDTVGNSCSAAFDLLTIPIGTTKSTSLTNLIGGNGNDEDWYKVSFPAEANCAYSPTISLSAGSLPIKMQIYTGCSGSSGTGSMTCNVSGESGNSVSNTVDRWDFTFNKACNNNDGAEDSGRADPFPGSGDFITASTTFYVRVFRTGPDPSNPKSCLPYTLTVSNVP